MFSSLLVAVLSLSAVNPAHGLITTSSAMPSQQHTHHDTSRTTTIKSSSPKTAQLSAFIIPHSRIKNTRSINYWKLHAANNGAAREYLASSLSDAEAAAENENIEAANYAAAASSSSSNNSTAADQTSFITSLISDDVAYLSEKINEEKMLKEVGTDDSTAQNDDVASAAKEEEVEDDDYASSMLFPVRSDIDNDGGSNNNNINNNNNNTSGGDDGDSSASSGSESNAIVNEDVEDCIINTYDEFDEQPPDLYPFANICTDSDTNKDSKVNDAAIADPSSTYNEKGDRATHSLLDEGEDIPDESSTTPAEGRSVARYLRRKLSRTNDKDNENEMTQEERRQKWTQWMTSGRKSSPGSSSGSSSTTTTTTSSSSTDVSLDESLLNIDKGEDYVVVAVPAEAVANNDVGVKMSSFPGGKLFQKTVANMQRELEIRNVTKVSSGGSDDGKQEQQQQEQDQQQQQQLQQQQDRAAQKQRKKKERNDKKNKEKVVSIELEKQMKLRQKQINLEQRIREKGRVTANDWKHNIGNLFASTILRDVRDPVLCLFTWATTWSASYKILSKVASGAISCKSDSFIAASQYFVRHASLPSLPHTIMVSSLSLLLVFRTNSAYQRFVEGRKIWNDIVDTSRDLSRYVKLYEFAIGTSKVRRINALLASFPYLLRHRIRPSLIAMRRVNDPEYERDPFNSLLLYPDASLRDTDPDVAALAYDGEEPGRRMKRELCWVDKRKVPWNLLPGSALELCARAQNRPLWVCDRMAKELSMVDDILPKWTNRERLALIGCVDKLSRSIGACERIHQTVVPLNYARHALRSLTVWLWTLPFVMAEDLGLLTGPVLAVLSWILFGVYEIGSRIEDPFQGTLRLSIYCDAIRRDVLTDSIARDTAFELEEVSKVSVDEEGDEDAIFELDSESEEYGGDDVPVQKKKKKDSSVDSFLEKLGL